MARPPKIAKLHALKYDIRMMRGEDDAQLVELQRQYDELLIAVAAEYETTKSELSRCIASDFGKWKNDAGLPDISS